MSRVKHVVICYQRQRGGKEMGEEGLIFFGHLNQFFGKYIALNMLDMLNGISVREEGRR